MQSNQQPEDDGLIVLQRLSPDHVDVVLGSHPGKRKPVPRKSSWSVGSTLIALALVFAGGFFVSQLLGHKPKAIPANELAKAPLPAEPTPEPPASTAAEPIRTLSQVIYTVPKTEEADSVDDTPSRPQGMVSDRYMAQYKAGGTQPKAEPSGRRYEVAGVFIREIDGRNRYEARFRVFNNHIENASMCFNFKGESAEYRECRRAAAPFLKDMCSDWTKRTAKDRNERNKLAQEQYCEAARTYTP
jgi:hypothetical protein